MARKRQSRDKQQKPSLSFILLRCAVSIVIGAITSVLGALLAVGMTLPGFLVVLFGIISGGAGLLFGWRWWLLIVDETVL